MCFTASHCICSLSILWWALSHLLIFMKKSAPLCGRRNHVYQALVVSLCCTCYTRTHYHFIRTRVCACVCARTCVHVHVHAHAVLCAPDFFYPPEPSSCLVSGSVLMQAVYGAHVVDVPRTRMCGKRDHTHERAHTGTVNGSRAPRPRNSQASTF